MIRRQFLKNIGFGVGAAVVTPASDVKAAVMDLGGASSLSSDVDPGMDCTTGTDVYPWQVVDHVRGLSQYQSSDMRHIPIEISAKKSWSPAFKVHVHAVHQRDMQMLEKRLQNSPDLLKKAIKLLDL